MSRARYTGAHSAKPAGKAPARKAPLLKEKLFRRPPPQHVRPAPVQEVSDRGTQNSQSVSEKTGRLPTPEREGTIRFPRAEPSRSGRIRVEQPVFLAREHRKPSRRMAFFAVAVAAALLLGAVAVLLRKPIDEGAYERNMARAAEAYEQADLDNALRYLRRAASFEETDDCLKMMATCYEQSGMLDKALELLRKIEPADNWTTGRIQRIEQQKARQKSADTVEVLGMSLPPDAKDLVLDGRELGDADLQELVKLYALDSLSLIDNHIRDLSPLAELGSLDVLNLSGNEISDLSPLAGMSGMRALYLDRNPLGDLSPLYELQNLNTLSIQGCGVGEEQLASLAAALPACAILSDATKEDVSDISLGGMTFHSDVKDLDLSGCGIRDISVLAACKGLRRLNLSGNEISNLQGLMNLPQLDSLDVSDNQISDLRPLMGIATLRRLTVSGNALTDTSALGTMTALQVLDISDNPVADFSGLRHLINLTSLKLGHTDLKDDDLYYLSELSMLTKLELDDNPSLSNEAYGMLKSSLPSCTISHTDLIYTISIENHPVSSNVTQLDLSGLGIADLTGLERLNSLETLDLSRNQISNLYVMRISASRETLCELNLAFNQIGPVSELVGLNALERLNLYGNPLSGVESLQSMTWLKWLNVGSCGLSETQIYELQNALPNCEIVLDA